MNRELIVNVTDHETRVALVEDGVLTEIFIERDDETNITGNIYKGIVQRVLPGMQAAFVDINLEQAAFLYVDDVIGKRISEEETDTSDEDIGFEEYSEGTLKDNPTSIQKTFKKSDLKIEDLITEGQEIMVQVVKSPIGSKGPRISSHISLPGRNLVLMPTVNHIGISRRIDDKVERTRLKNNILKLRKSNYGYILRTVSEGIAEDKLFKEMELLDNSWQSIKESYKTAAAPTLLHKDLTVTLRLIRDLLAQSANKIIIDSYSGYKSILTFIDSIIPEIKIDVEYFNKKSELIFDHYHIENDIIRALKKKVWLKSGGYLIIEQTEALVSIDVNTGRYIGKQDFEETVLKINLEAVEEIAYQVRLRNLGGIIIIDFIDMESSENKEKVYNALKDALRKDKSKTSVLPMSEMGLIQMTRKRVTKSLLKMMCEPCFYCDGNGLLLSKKTTCYEIFKEILREENDMIGNTINIRVNPQIADLLNGKEKNLIFIIGNRIDKKIEIIPDNQLHLEEFKITGKT